MKDLSSFVKRDYKAKLIFRKEKWQFLNKILRIIYSEPIFYSVKRRPVMVICETVNICNNKCLICANSKMTRKKMIMPLDLFEKLLRDYSDIGGGKLSLTPMIGEIFMDKFLIERLNLIKKYPKISGVSMTTNASVADLFSDSDLKIILNSFDRVHISIYGLDDEEYFTMTGRDEYGRMLENVKKIILYSPRNVVFGFRLLKKYDDCSISDWILKNFNMAVPYSTLTTFSNWGGAIDTSIPLPFNGQWLQVKENTAPCFMPLVACQVYSNGDVSFCPCPDYNIEEELRLGNIKSQSLESIYNSKKATRLLQIRKNLPNFCKKCSFHKPAGELEKYESLFENPVDFIGG